MAQVSIKHLLGADAGTTAEERITVEHPASLFVIPDDGILGVLSPLEATVSLLRIEEGFEAQIEDLQVTLELQCYTCMQPYSYDLSINTTSEVLFALPHATHDAQPDFEVDVVKARLPIDEWLRQEVVMALPTHQKCTRKDCIVAETPPPVDDIKPFAGLKDLLG